MTETCAYTRSVHYMIMSGDMISIKRMHTFRNELQQWNTATVVTCLCAESSVLFEGAYLQQC